MNSRVIGGESAFSSRIFRAPMGHVHELSNTEFLNLEYLLSLHRREIRDRDGRFVIEGIRFVNAAVQMSAHIVGLVVAPKLEEASPWSPEAVFA